MSVLEQITLWQRRKERERLYCGTGYGQFCVFSLDLATSCRYARASLDDATDYATSLGVVAFFLYRPQYRPTVVSLDGKGGSGVGGHQQPSDKKKSLPFVFHLRRAYRTFINWNILINTVTPNLLWLAVFTWLWFLVSRNLLWCLLLNIL